MPDMTRVLRQQLVQCNNAVDHQIGTVRREAESMGIPPATMRDANGGWVMVPLLNAKAQCLLGLTILNQGK